MGDSGEANLAKLNKAGEAISEDLFRAGFDRAEEYASRFGIAESEMPLVLANAFFRVAVHANAIVFRLDGEDLGKRVMQAIKDAAREASQP
jgi:hypothetical protein